MRQDSPLSHYNALYYTLSLLSIAQSNAFSTRHEFHCPFFRPVTCLNYFNSFGSCFPSMLLSQLSVENLFCIIMKNQLGLQNISAIAYSDYNIIVAFRRRCHFQLATCAKPQASNLLRSLVTQLPQRCTSSGIAIKLLSTSLRHSEPYTKVPQKNVQLKNACSVTSC